MLDETSLTINPLDMVEAPPKPKRTKKNGERVTRMSNEERITILTMSAGGRSIGDIARVIKRSESGISKYLASMIDTTEIAKRTLRAGAVNLAERIIKKADVKEAIEVLSRPSVGVLDPPASQKGGQGFGIQVSVGIASCGTVVKIEGGSGGQAGLSQGGTIDAGSGKFEAQPAEVPRIEAGSHPVVVPPFDGGQGPDQ